MFESMKKLGRLVLPCLLLFCILPNPPIINNIVTPKQIRKEYSKFNLLRQSYTHFFCMQQQQLQLQFQQKTQQRIAQMLKTFIAAIILIACPISFQNNISLTTFMVGTAEGWLLSQAEIHPAYWHQQVKAKLNTCHWYRQQISLRYVTVSDAPAPNNSST